MSKYYVFGVVIAHLEVNASSAADARAVAHEFVRERTPNFVDRGSKAPVISARLQLLTAATQRK